MDFAKGKPTVRSFKSSGRRLSVFFPFLCLASMTYSPLGVLTTCRSSTSAPFERANPIAAFVGLLSWSKAAFLAGPKNSSSRSGCCDISPLTQIAKRLGVAAVRIDSYCNSSPASFSAMVFCIFSRAGPMNPAGISSEPISSNNSFCIVSYHSCFYLYFYYPGLAG